MTVLAFRLADYGTTFSTREKARMVGLEIAARTTGEYVRLVVNFSGVRILSYSFADELLRQLDSALSKSTVTEAVLSDCDTDVFAILKETLAKGDGEAVSNLDRSHRPTRKFSLMASSSGR